MSFEKVYQHLKNNNHLRFSIQIYHNDDSGEPFFSAESDVEKVSLDFVEGHGLIIGIITPESLFSFTEKNWLSHVGNSYVSFGSANDGETYCIVEFC